MVVPWLGETETYSLKEKRFFVAFRKFRFIGGKITVFQILLGLKLYYTNSE
jgi:hypothetical protein